MIPGPRWSGDGNAGYSHTRISIYGDRYILGEMPHAEHVKKLLTWLNSSD